MAIKDNSTDYNKFWSPAFDTMDDFVFLIDNDFDVRYVNKSFLVFAKGKKADFLGKKCHEVVHEECSPINKCPHKQTMDTGKFASSEFYEPRLKKWLYVRTTPIFADNGKLLGSIHMAADVSARREIQESINKEKKEYENIFDSVPAWIFYKDKENRFIKVNRAFAEAMKMSKEELEGKSLFDIYEKQDAETYWADDLDVIRSGKPKTGIIESMKSKIGTLWVQTDKIPYRDIEGKIVGIIGFTLDITERKQAEIALKKRMSELERFQRITVDRELRMKDLKSRIAKLERKMDPSNKDE